jgi:small subunit ribosomal protein S2
MHLLYISIVQLSNYKIFIGHSILNTLLLSSWLIFNLRGKTTILNMYNTIKILKLSYTFIKHIINAGLPVWFINFDLTKENIIIKNASRAGEFYCTRKWIRGLLSNFYYITKAFRKYLVKKEFIEINKVKDIFDKWFLTRFTWPRLIFISNIKTSLIVSKEASSVKMPMIALVDSNVKTHLYNLPIGSNDDSLDSIGFMNNIISYYIVQSKYKNVLIWYYFNRNITRFQSLGKWLKKLIKLKKKIKNRIKLKNMKIPHFINYYLEVKKGLNFFFGRSYNFKLFKKNNITINNNINLDHYYNRNKVLLYNKIKVLKYIHLSYKYRIKLKRSVYKKKIEGITLFKSFLNNFIKIKNIPKRFKRIKIKKRNRMERRRIPRKFRAFFYFIFFFYLNKFNIIIDSYYRNLFSFNNLIKLYNTYTNKKKEKRYKFTYMFKYKSKRIYKKRKSKKNGIIYNNFEYIDKDRISFLFFYWKYFIIFLGLNLRRKWNIFRNKKFIFKNKKIKK